MYLAYSADPRMRINVGIRRRLAPLVDNNRRRIELLNSLLLSFPGTPILYYGDEIGMGDNIYLGDRNGVRTPMQWNSDRNAGFSKGGAGQALLPCHHGPDLGLPGDQRGSAAVRPVVAAALDAQHDRACANSSRSSAGARSSSSIRKTARSSRISATSIARTPMGSLTARTRRSCAWPTCRALRSRSRLICRRFEGHAAGRNAGLCELSHHYATRLTR